MILNVTPCPIRRYPAGADDYVLYNTLGSLTEVQNSIIGPNGRIDGTVSYPSGQVGNGVYGGVPRSNRIVFYDGTDILPNTSAYTIEHYFKPDFSCTNGVATVSAALQWGLTTSTSNTTTWDFFNYESAGSYWQGKADGGSSVITPRLNTVSGLTFSASTWYQIRYVIDKNGIDGSSDTLRVYLDGSLIMSYTSSRPISTGSIKCLTLSSYNDSTNSSTAGGQAVFDELKVWDYANIVF